MGVLGIFFPRPRLTRTRGGWFGAWPFIELGLSALDLVLEEDLDLERERLLVFLTGGCSGMANSSPTLGLSTTWSEGTTATKFGSDTEEVATTVLCGAEGVSAGSRSR